MKNAYNEYDYVYFVMAIGKLIFNKNFYEGKRR